MSAAANAAGVNPQELKRLWLACFDDTPQAVDLFFAAYPPQRHAVACCEDGRIVAAFYLLPARLADENGRARPAAYLYAAGTLPQYRGRGLMGRLLKEGAARCSAWADALVLLPASAALYGFYRQHGFVNFYACNRLVLDRSALKEYIRSHWEPFAAAQAALPPRKAEADIAGMRRVRDGVLHNRPGSLLWSEAAVAYAAGAARLYGGGVVQAGQGYALYQAPDAGGTLEVTELMAQEQALPALLQKLLALPAKRYRFRLPAEEEAYRGLVQLAGPAGELAPFGMARWLRGCFMQPARPPYLGLPLD